MASIMENKKLLIYKILITILIMVALIIAGIIIKKQYDDQVYDKENIEIFKQFEEQINKNRADIEAEDELSGQNNKVQLKYQGYNVIGLIQIPAIDLEYPILEKTTQQSMKTSISRFYGGEINGYGNVSLAGHNNYSGTMFGKNKKLKLGDKVLLTGLDGNTLEYEIYDIFVTDPNDTSILETKDDSIREVTLITCKNGRSERLIIKAKNIN